MFFFFFLRNPQLDRVWVSYTIEGHVRLLSVWAGESRALADVKTHVSDWTKLVHRWPSEV